MKKGFYLILTLFFLSLIPSKVLAQTETVYIEDFKAEVNVQEDGIVNITEEILYVFNESRHGMYRQIPIAYELENGETQYLDISITDVSYKSVNNTTVYNTYSKTSGNEYINLKIGEPNTFIQGKYLYTISYNIKYLIENYNNMDKLYLNILGPEWEDPIYHASATITMPSEIIDSNCYTGPKGSTTGNCSIKKQNGNEIFVNSTEIFRGNQHFTITATVAPGTIQDLSEEKAQYTPTIQQSPENFFSTIARYISIGVFIFILFIILTMIFLVFRKKKRNQFSGLNTKEYLPNTIPQYNILPGWDVLKTDILLNKSTSNSAITGQIIQLCIYGYLRMTKNGNEITLYKTNKSITDLVEHLQLFYKGIMQDKTSVILPKKIFYNSEPNEDDMLILQMFFHSLKIVQMQIYDKLKKDQYFNEIKQKKTKSYKSSLIILILFLLMAAGFISGFVTSNSLLTLLSLSIGFVLIFVVIIWDSFKANKNEIPKYSEKGEEIIRYIHGLHMYIDTAEEERIKFHNDPEKYKGVFENLLPYAILFGLEEKWVKLFNIQNLLWFNSDSGSDFSIGEITSSISSFARTSTSLLNSSGGGSSSSSGSSGGSSGGGGGGGGGGSW